VAKASVFAEATTDRWRIEGCVLWGASCEARGLYTFLRKNPPFCDEFFDVTDCAGVVVLEMPGKFGGSFWKTNPPGGCFEGLSIRNGKNLMFWAS